MAHADPAAVDLELVEARDLGSSPRQEQFSLVFRGPLDVFLPQRMYQMQHDRLGAFGVFLVPIGQAPDGYSYQAVFNRLRPG